MGIHHQVLVITINIIGLWLAAMVSKHEENKSTIKAFVMMIVFMFGWVNFAYFARRSGDQEAAALMLRVAWVATPLLFFSLYLFIISYLKKEEKYKILTGIITFLAIALSIITGFTNLIIESSKQINGALAINYGRAMYPFLGAIFFFMIAPLVIIVSEYFYTSKGNKTRLQYVTTGILLFYLMNAIFNIFLPLQLRIVRLYWIGDYSSIILLGFITYAVIKKDLFEIKVVLTTILVGLITILLVVDLFTFTDNLIVQIFKGVTLIAFIFLGRYLIRSVLAEIKRREELEELSNELVETNTELKEANKKLRKLDKAKSEFISIASHQLRTPLTAIKGYLSMIISGSYGEISGEVRDKMEKVLKSSDRLINLVNDLLDASKLESGKLEMKFEEVDLNKYITDIVEEFKVVAEEEELYLNLETGEDMLVHMDKERIRQAILNVVDNAIKYTEEGGIVIRTKKKISDSQEFALIEIEDTGQGMSEEEIDNIFKSFSRGSAGDLMHIEGAGLGLYIAKKFVDMHQGEIWLESEGKEQGTAFFVELPLSQK